MVRVAWLLVAAGILGPLRNGELQVHRSCLPSLVAVHLMPRSSPPPHPAMPHAPCRAGQKPLFAAAGRKGEVCAAQGPELWVSPAEPGKFVLGMRDHAGSVALKEAPFQGKGFGEHIAPHSCRLHGAQAALGLSSGVRRAHAFPPHPPRPCLPARTHRRAPQAALTFGSMCSH